jgi:raffinose/stachyose/melibiose transport system permease protein
MSKQPGRRIGRRSATSVGRSTYLFAIPAVLTYGLLFAWPTLQALFYSRTGWAGPGTSADSVGMENFKELLTNDSGFVEFKYRVVPQDGSVWVTLKFMLLVTIFQTILALFYAVFLVRNTKPRIALRALFFFPTILSSTAVAFVWAFVYDPASGLIASVIDRFGFWKFKDWTPAMLGSPKTALYMIVIVQLWFHVGQMIVIFVAGLQQIPTEFYEAAAIDGASRGQLFRKITWPLIAPATVIVSSYTTIQAFKAFDLVYILTEGGPLDSTKVLSLLVYRTAFQNNQFGYAAAQSVLFMALIVAVTFVQRRVLRLTGVNAKEVAG